jgi:hypothetical protein
MYHMEHTILLFQIPSFDSFITITNFWNERKFLKHYIHDFLHSFLCFRRFLQKIQFSFNFLYIFPYLGIVHLQYLISFFDRRG